MKKKLLLLSMLLVFILTACDNDGQEPLKSVKLILSERVKTEYAECFSIDRYEEGYSLISTSDGSKYLIVPEGKEIPDDINSDTHIIRQPADKIYLAATSAMSMWDALGKTDSIDFSGIKEENWFIANAANAMNSGDMVYAGKYREPDYELLLTEGCRLAIESSMINHSPEVKEKLEELGITVFTDLSSYENHPLGRSEWIKLYGEIAGERELAETLFNEQAAYLNSGEPFDETGKTAAYFYISESGQAVTRKSGDYICRMIELAGGRNIFDNVGDVNSDNSFSSVTMEPEMFYKTAKDADYIIYNSTIGGEITSVDELVGKCPLLSDFKAVKNGDVWCTRQSFFQETMKIGNIISDFNAVFTDNTDDNSTQFIYKLESGEKNE